MLTTVLPSTWRNLGLGVAVSFATFGLSGILFPQHAAQSAFGITAQAKDVDKGLDNSGAVLLPPLIGVRDLVIAATLAMLYYRQLGWEMGFVIVSRAILCAADTLLITRQKGLHEYAFHSSPNLFRILCADSAVVGAFWQAVV